MLEKTLIVLATTHEIQNNDETKNPHRNEFREMLLSVIQTFQVQVIFEEWSTKLGTSVALAIKEQSEDGDLKWFKTNPPPTAEYDTYAPRLNFDPDKPHLSFRQYSFEPQDKRERYMVETLRKTWKHAHRDS